MDNPNNPNQPPDTSFPPASSPLDLNSSPQPAAVPPSDPPPSQPDPVPAQWGPAPQPQPQPQPVPSPVQPEPSSTTQQDYPPVAGSQGWPLAPQPQSPASPFPHYQPVEPPAPAASTWPQQSAYLDSTPTPPSQELQQQPEAATSSLDNPWGTPLQPPPIDNPLPPQPEPAPASGPTGLSESTFQPPAAPPEPAPELSSMGSSFQETQQPESTLPDTGSSVPTDLSHLITGTPDTPPTTGSETLVVPPTTIAPEVPTMTTENHGGIPKWVIGLGVGLLIIVAGASAYFILGIGQSPKNTSIPATTKTPPQQINPPAPVVQPPQPTETPATGSASFGTLEGGRTATRAADLLKQSPHPK